MKRTKDIQAGTAFVVTVAAVSISIGCAILKLNGCRRLDSCGEVGAYVCGTDLICADRAGNTIRSEPFSRRTAGCGICDGNGSGALK